MQTKTKLLSILLLFTLTIIPCLAVNAEPTISISLYKDNGYGWGNDMSGLWTVNTQVSTDIISVEFYLDDQLQQEDTSSPFSWQFSTNDYNTGEHTIKAVAYGNQGSSQTAQLTRNFVEDNTNTILVVVIAAVAAVFAVLVVAAVYRIKKSKK